MVLCIPILTYFKVKQNLFFFQKYITTNLYKAELYHSRYRDKIVESKQQAIFKVTEFYNSILFLFPLFYHTGLNKKTWFVI